ncbi:tetratricopeptide repeat protein [Aggregatimonas sangjinii]|uniref:Tetratricopeptide repeat protein n=1 Tax=Aggregatimonas sangjinii TaxID=2583587 RepID=A0A5B7SPI0_9FLAO|nr:tetratricopeptide repeat protein [Aggregatimonas sangjinii]QCW98939.1 tetratricopeptide repeat protein [Aggregatimonas sangjinii]
MKPKNLVVFLSSLLILFTCKDDSQKIDLASLNLLRGDLQLCGSGQFGELKFSLSCNYETRDDFDLAVALLHSFQYADAEKAFVKVIDADPDCPMAYWGVAMSIYHAAWFPPSEKDLIKGAKVLAVAKNLAMDEKQRAYINAIDAFYADWQNVDHNTRALRFEKAMEKIHHDYPEDVEAAIFYTLALYSTRDRVGKDYKNERKAGKILESLFADNPNHPGIAHYIIHNYDNPVLADKGLETARRYAKIAPSSSHAQHMPSHIFTRLGIWEESIQSNIQSAESARCYKQAMHINDGFFEEIHAIDYLVYAYLQQGDNTRAEREYNAISASTTVHPLNVTAVMYPLAAIPARMALENKNWNKAASLQLQETGLDWEKFPWQKAIHHFARALGAAHTKDFAQAEAELLTLKVLHQKMLAENDRSIAIQVKQVEIQMKTAEAWRHFSENATKKAIALMQEAAALERNTSLHPLTPGDVLPAIELLGDMYLAMNKPEEALMAYEENLNKTPKRFNGLYGAALAAERSGNKEKAIHYFQELIELTKNSSSLRPEIVEAKEFILQS